METLLKRHLFTLALAAGFALPGGLLHAQSEDTLPLLSCPHLSLRDALGLASANNLMLKQSQADADMASASARSARSQTKPSLSTTTYATTGDSANILTSSPGVLPQNIFSVPPRGFADQNLMLMVPLLTAGRLANTAAAARGQGDAAQLAVQAERLTVAGAVTESYADAVLQHVLVGVAQARLTAEEEQVRITQAKVAAGRSAPVDLLRERAEQADARHGLLAAQNNEALALVTLKTTLGLSQASLLTLSDTLDTLLAPFALPPTLQSALAEAGAKRPELAAAQRQVDAARAMVTAARGEYAPQVYGVAMGDVSAGQGTGRSGYTVGITASVPLYDAGQRRATLDGAQARLSRARIDLLQARQTIGQQVASAWLTLATAAAQVEAASAGVSASQESYTLAALRYNAGKSVAAERLDALAALVRAQGALAQAKAGLAVARARLQAATAQ